MNLSCRYLELCRGCPLGSLEYSDQKEQKKQKLLDALERALPAQSLKNTTFEFIFPVFDKYRTRCDFVFLDGHLGWYTSQRQFQPIKECALHVPELTEFARKIEKMNWPIQKGSMRFRVSPAGTLGVWLDFANIDIKTTLSSARLLPELLEQGVVVEMGQKGRRVIQKEQLKLSNPFPFPWFTTWHQEKPTPLKTLVSSFTQTSPELNVQMIQLIAKIIEDRRFEQIVEFGSGTGNFTLFLSMLTQKVFAIENDRRNLVPLTENIKDSNLEPVVSVIESMHDFVALKTSSVPQNQLYFVNPSRSGVGPLFDQNITANEVLYISCHLESFINDIVKLDKQGFQLVHAILFDQFPHSNHFEIISLLRKK